MIKAYFYKISRSALFYISIAGVFLMCSMRIMLDGAFSGGDILMEVNILIEIDAFRKAIAVFAAIPFAANFSNEWKSNITDSCVLRSSANKYISANIIYCFLTSFIVVLIGMLLFIFLYTLRLPLYVFDPNPKIPPFGILIDKGFPVLYLIIKITIFSVSCAMWSMSGIAIAAFFPDSFVAVCTPFIAGYLLERISMQLPDVFNLWYLSMSRISVFNNMILSFFYSILVFLVLSMCFGTVFAIVVKRRIRNEIV